jgi:hypothetical protein
MKPKFLRRLVKVESDFSRDVHTEMASCQAYCAWQVFPILMAFTL